MYHGSAPLLYIMSRPNVTVSPPDTGTRRGDRGTTGDRRTDDRVGGVNAYGSRLRIRTPSPALRRVRLNAAPLSDDMIRRRLAWVWGLLFLNVLPYSAESRLIPMPTPMGKVITQGALVIALFLALSINPKALVRPNLFLLLVTILSITSLMLSVHGYFGLGSTVRAFRFMGMVAVLWLLTPWWGRRDFLLLRYHRRALFVVLVIVVLGIAIAPGAAFSQGGGGRLGGVVWPVPPTQVAEYAAVLGGTTIVLWFSGLVRNRGAAAVSLGCIVVLLLTHTRTALIGFLLGVLVSGLSLFLTRARVRKAIGITLIVAFLLALSFAPFLSSWFLRGQTSHAFSNFSGRSEVWTALQAAPRSEVNTIFGYGLSNDSFNGLPIDSTWYSTYLDQGLVGDVIDGAVLLLIALIALFSARGPRRALALFIVTYCFIASFTETGLGQASPYLLDLAVAMSVLMVPALDGPVVAPPIELPAV